MGYAENSALFAVHFSDCVTHILNTGINCASEIFRKTVFQTVSAGKRFAKSFYESANYDGGQYSNK